MPIIGWMSYAPPYLIDVYVVTWTAGALLYLVRLSLSVGAYVPTACAVYTTGAAYES